MKSRSSNGPFRAAVLGAGVIAGPHGAALKRLSGVEMAAVCDLDESKARAFAASHGIPLVFSDLGEMLAKVSPDVVHVLLPPVAHASAAKECLEAGSHVFVEKPFCASSAECRRVERAAQDAGRTIGVNHNLTFMPGVLKMVDLIRSCRLGALQHVRVMYNLPAPGIAAGPHDHWMFAGTGNLMLELGPHPVSVICRLLGNVTAASTAVSGELTLSNGTRFFGNWQSSLVCERGSAQMVLCLGDGYGSTGIHAIGQDGEVWVDLARNTVRISEKTKYLRLGQLVDGWRGASQLRSAALRNFWGYAKGAVGIGPAHQMQNYSVNGSVASFYQALREERAPLIGGAEGTAVVEACEMVIESGLAFAAQSGVERAAVR